MLRCCSKEKLPNPDSDLFYHVCPSKLSKRELEDLYFNVLAANLNLKKKVAEQDEKLKNQSTKLQRMANSQRNSISRDDKDSCASTKAIIEEHNNTISDLQHLNDELREQIKNLNMKLCSTRQYSRSILPKRGFAKNKASSARTIGAKNASTSALTSDSNDPTTFKSGSSQYLNKLGHTKKGRSQQMTPSPRVNDGNPTQPCDENRCKTLIEELKEKIANLQEELSKTHDEYEHRIKRLEQDMTQLYSENIRIRSDSATKEHDLNMRTNEANDMKKKLKEIEAISQDLMTNLNIEKAKVAELQTQVKAANMTSDAIKNMEQRFSKENTAPNAIRASLRGDPDTIYVDIRDVEFHYSDNPDKVEIRDDVYVDKSEKQKYSNVFQTSGHPLGETNNAITNNTRTSTHNEIRGVGQHKDSNVYQSTGSPAEEPNKTTIINTISNEPANKSGTVKQPSSGSIVRGQNTKQFGPTKRSTVSPDSKMRVGSIDPSDICQRHGHYNDSFIDRRIKSDKNRLSKENTHLDRSTMRTGSQNLSNTVTSTVSHKPFREYNKNFQQGTGMNQSGKYNQPSEHNEPVTSPRANQNINKAITSSIFEEQTATISQTKPYNESNNFIQSGPNNQSARCQPSTSPRQSRKLSKTLAPPSLVGQIETFNHPKPVYKSNDVIQTGPNNQSGSNEPGTSPRESRKLSKTMAPPGFVGRTDTKPFNEPNNIIQPDLNNESGRYEPGTSPGESRKLSKTIAPPSLVGQTDTINQTKPSYESSNVIQLGQNEIQSGTNNEPGKNGQPTESNHLGTNLREGINLIDQTGTVSQPKPWCKSRIVVQPSTDNQSERYNQPSAYIETANDFKPENNFRSESISQPGNTGQFGGEDPEAGILSKSMAADQPKKLKTREASKAREIEEAIKEYLNHNNNLTNFTNPNPTASSPNAVNPGNFPNHNIENLPFIKSSGICNSCNRRCNEMKDQNGNCIEITHQKNPDTHIPLPTQEQNNVTNHKKYSEDIVPNIKEDEMTHQNILLQTHEKNNITNSKKYSEDVVSNIQEDEMTHQNIPLQTQEKNNVKKYSEDVVPNIQEDEMKNRQKRKRSSFDPIQIEIPYHDNIKKIILRPSYAAKTNEAPIIKIPYEDNIQKFIVNHHVKKDKDIQIPYEGTMQQIIVNPQAIKNTDIDIPYEEHTQRIVNPKAVKQGKSYGPNKTQTENKDAKVEMSNDDDNIQQFRESIQNLKNLALRCHCNAIKSNAGKLDSNCHVTNDICFDYQNDEIPCPCKETQNKNNNGIDSVDVDNRQPDNIKTQSPKHRSSKANESTVFDQENSPNTYTTEYRSQYYDKLSQPRESLKPPQNTPNNFSPVQTSPESNVLIQNKTATLKKPNVEAIPEDDEQEEDTSTLPSNLIYKANDLSCHCSDCRCSRSKLAQNCHPVTVTNKGAEDQSQETTLLNRLIALFQQVPTNTSDQSNPSSHPVVTEDADNHPEDMTLLNRLIALFQQAPTIATNQSKPLEAEPAESQSAASSPTAKPSESAVQCCQENCTFGRIEATIKTKPVDCQSAADTSTAKPSDDSGFTDSCQTATSDDSKKTIKDTKELIDKMAELQTQLDNLRACMMSKNETPCLNTEDKNMMSKKETPCFITDDKNQKRGGQTGEQTESDDSEVKRVSLKLEPETHSDGEVIAQWPHVSSGPNDEPASCKNTCEKEGFGCTDECKSSNAIMKKEHTEDDYRNQIPGPLPIFQDARKTDVGIHSEGSVPLLKTYRDSLTYHRDKLLSDQVEKITNTKTNLKSTVTDDVYDQDRNLNERSRSFSGYPSYASNSKKEDLPESMTVKEAIENINARSTGEGPIATKTRRISTMESLNSRLLPHSDVSTDKNTKLFERNRESFKIPSQDLDSRNLGKSSDSSKKTGSPTENECKCFTKKSNKSVSCFCDGYGEKSPKANVEQTSQKQHRDEFNPNYLDAEKVMTAHSKINKSADAPNVDELSTQNPITRRQSILSSVKHTEQEKPRKVELSKQSLVETMDMSEKSGNMESRKSEIIRKLKATTTTKHVGPESQIVGDIADVEDVLNYSKIPIDYQVKKARESLMESNSKLPRVYSANENIFDANEQIITDGRNDKRYSLSSKIGPDAASTPKGNIPPKVTPIATSCSLTFVMTSSPEQSDKTGQHNKLGTQIDEEMGKEKDTAPKTYTVQALPMERTSRATSPANTDQEISSMTDLPSEKESNKQPRTRSSSKAHNCMKCLNLMSPGEDRATITYSDASTMPSSSSPAPIEASGSSLSEGEMPHYKANHVISATAERRDYSVCIDPNPTKKAKEASGVRTAAEIEMGRALAAISAELTRCRELLEKPAQNTETATSTDDRKVSRDKTEVKFDEEPKSRASSIVLRPSEARPHVSNSPNTPHVMFTLHIGTIVLSDEAVIFSRDMSLVLSWRFYNQNVAMSHMRPGRVVHFDFSTEYDVKLTDEFLQYLKSDELSLNVCEVSKLDTPLASASLPLREALLHTNRRADMSLALIAGPLMQRRPGEADALDSRDEMGVLDVWCMLRAEPRILPRINRKIANCRPSLSNNPLDDDPDAMRVSEDLEPTFDNARPSRLPANDPELFYPQDEQDDNQIRHTRLSIYGRDLKTGVKANDWPTSSEFSTFSAGRRRYTRNSTDGGRYTRNSTDGCRYTGNSTDVGRFTGNSTDGGRYTRNSTDGCRYTGNSTDVGRFTGNSTDGGRYTGNSTDGGRYTGNSKDDVRNIGNSTDGGRYTENSPDGDRYTENNPEGGRYTGNSTDGGRYTRNSIDGGRYTGNSTEGGRYTRNSTDGGRYTRNSLDGVSPQFLPKSVSSGFIINDVPAQISSNDQMKKVISERSRTDAKYIEPQSSGKYDDQMHMDARLSAGQLSIPSLVSHNWKSNKYDKQDLYSLATRPSSYHYNKRSLIENNIPANLITNQDVEPTRDRVHKSDGGSEKKVTIRGRGRNSIKSFMIPGNKTTLILEDTETITIWILWLALNEECSAMSDPLVQRLYVAYSFLGYSGAELETPMSLPKPKKYQDKCIFNFKKSFQPNDANVETLARMARCRSQKKDATTTNDCVVFTVVSEPVEDPLGLNNCEDVGTAKLYFGDLLTYSAGSDTYTEVLPIHDSRTEDDICGVLAVRVDGLDVVRKCLSLMTAAGNFF